jgi:hypothetical protein
MHRLSALFMRSLILTVVLCVSLDVFAGIPDASAQIDEILERGYAEAGIDPNAPIDDERFLRRIYLDAIGRIPTLDETRSFLASTDSEKRARLVDELLASEGAVSHGFNFWADILRLKERVGNNRLQTYAYSLWLKDALRKNLPYDEFVRQLVTARGWIWENGATGFYHRDRGMPLDNMSNTIRVFLGTRLECAQCHDHPFDRWTQMDYFKMAAFSYSMDARLYAPSGRTAISEFQSEFVKAARERAANGVVERGSPDYLRYKAIGRVNADLFAFMKYVLCRDTPQTLTLPHDYQYEDAKPEDPVSPATMFGESIEADSVDNLVDAYADWLTSPENPRFAAVIANRLWKRAMGRGLIEPVDEVMDHSVASNPELLEYLTNRVIELDFDMWEFQREIYNTRVYQREVTTRDVPLSEPYPFPGPVVRRLTAEQIWDSLVTLAIPNPDYFMPQLNMRLSQVDRLREIHASLGERSDEEFIALTKRVADYYAETYMEVEDLSARHSAALAEGDEEKAARIGKKLSGLRNQSKSTLEKMTYGDRVPRGQAETLYPNFGIGGEHLPLNRIVKTLPSPRTGSGVGAKEEAGEWRTVSADLMRSSELPTPAPRGHFLREFGQSDREVIENSSDGASVPQALTLLNGPFAATLANPHSVLQIGLGEAEVPSGKLETLFLAVFSRKPTAREAELFQDELERDEGNVETALESFLWIMLHSQQFRACRKSGDLISELAWPAEDPRRTRTSRERSRLLPRQWHTSAAGHCESTSSNRAIVLLFVPPRLPPVERSHRPTRSMPRPGRMSRGLRSGRDSERARRARP